MISQAATKTWYGGLNDCLSYCYERLQKDKTKSYIFECEGTTVQASVSAHNEIDLQLKPTKTNE